MAKEMRLIQVTGATMRERAANGVISVNVAQGEDGTAVLCLECLTRKGEHVGYFNTWESQVVLRDKLKTWRNLEGLPLFVDMARVGKLPAAAEKVGIPPARA